jgi:hypothetical protein
MLVTFKFGSNDKHVRKALTAAFSKRGVDLRDLDPIIQSTMVAEALSTGAEEQVGHMRAHPRIEPARVQSRTPHGAKSAEYPAQGGACIGG